MVSNRTHTPPPLTYCILIYRTLIHTGKAGGGGELNQRAGERGNRGEHRLQSWVENTNMTECTQKIGYLQSINSDKHLPQNPLTSSFCR
jgi:hypothetical protein